MTKHPQAPIIISLCWYASYAFKVLTAELRDEIDAGEVLTQNTTHPHTQPEGKHSTVVNECRE
jgi:hypothetical protein